jgi:superfamily II DNA or RNA helicase/HKD family nuclease
VALPPTLLRAIRRSPDPFLLTHTPLSQSALLTGALDEPRLGLELEREVASADSVDALISFVTWEGWRRLEPALTSLAHRGGRLRLITTTYTGATDAEAVAAIARLPGVEVRLSYDGRRTRLHAKAWLFKRHSGFSTAWVGSANLSGAALAGGLEWTMKATQVDLPHVLDKFTGTFETLWNDGEFEPFDPADDLPRLQEALNEQRGRATPTSTVHFFATLRPYPFQQEILDQLQVERELHGRHRNLVVAATGTGKTLLSAFDYQRHVPESGLKPRLLFVAHRDELLGQSLEAFRHVLRDAAFGERLGAGYEPGSHDFLFTTVQSFASRHLAEKCGPEFWDYVVVDECHHSTAETYSQVVTRLRPKTLVGLTATPERADGVDILPYFDGRIAAEVRLWHALDRQLLTPFDYYGLADATDLSGVDWKAPVVALDSLYTGNERRAELVLEQFQKHRGDLGQARALGFCVSVAHAEYMARKFTEAGVPSIAVHGRSSDGDRSGAPGRLERREVNVLFTCDLYNEGVDLPFVDTLLFLRPTNSPTVFLQQLGRGLRLDKRKTTCLVLDFIGTNYRKFRFDRLFSSLTGLPRGRLQEAVESGFPTLPSGCSLRLDQVSQKAVLENLRQTIQGGVRRLAQELRDCTRARGREITLAEFLEDTGRPLSDVYDIDGFTALRVAAGMDPAPLTDAEEALARRLRLLLHTDDPVQLHLLDQVAGDEGATAFDAHGQRRLLMLGYQLWHDLSDRFGPEEALRRCRPSDRLRAELASLAVLLRDQVGLTAAAIVPASWTLQLHRRYMRREVLAATGAWTAQSKPSNREGVLRLGESDEVFFVTLVKDEKRFSPTTRYRDYAISRDLFHWQSQSSTTADGTVGRRYREGRARFWLCVRRTQEDPYVFLGPVRYVGHEGSKPMSITWKLETPMPAGLFQEWASLVAA